MAAAQRKPVLVRVSVPVAESLRRDAAQNFRSVSAEAASIIAAHFARLAERDALSE